MVTSQILRDAKSCFYFGAGEEAHGMADKFCWNQSVTKIFLLQYLMVCIDLVTTRQSWTNYSTSLDGAIAKTPFFSQEQSEVVQIKQNAQTLSAEQKEQAL